MTRTAKPMDEVICDTKRIALSQRILDAKPEARAELIKLRDTLPNLYTRTTYRNGKPETVTAPAQSVTKLSACDETTVTKPPECDETKVGRPKKYASRAEQAKAYRERKKNK